MTLIIEAARNFLLGAAVLAALVFLPAGTLDYWQGWLAIVVILAALTAIGLYLAVYDPALLARRKKFGPGAETLPQMPPPAVGEMPLPLIEAEAGVAGPDNLRVFPAPASATDASLQLARQVARLLASPGDSDPQSADGRRRMTNSILSSASSRQDSISVM